MRLALPDGVVQQTLDRFGRIDTLVNNAAMQARLPLLEFPEELMQKSVNTNVWGTVRMMKAVLPHMIERNYGRIVSIGGTAFEAAVPYHTFLGGIGKGSVVGLTTTVAAEYGKWNITANCVSPAGMETRNRRHPRLGGWTAGRPSQPDQGDAGLLSPNGWAQLAGQGPLPSRRGGGCSGLPRLFRGLLHHRAASGCQWRRPHGLGPDRQGERP